MKSWQEFVSGVKYKPNFKIEHIYEIDYDEEYVFFEMLVPDRDNPTRTARVTMRKALPHRSHFESEEVAASYFRPWIRQCFQEMELHEVDENLTFNGERVFDPHA